MNFQKIALTFLRNILVMFEDYESKLSLMKLKDPNRIVAVENAINSLENHLKTILNINDFCEQYKIVWPDDIANIDSSEFKARWSKHLDSFVIVIFYGHIRFVINGVTYGIEKGFDNIPKEFLERLQKEYGA